MFGYTTSMVAWKGDALRPRGQAVCAWLEPPLTAQTRLPTLRRPRE